jgi:diguanylate cyclase (GGDEF)-like protein
VSLDDCHEPQGIYKQVKKIINLKDPKEDISQYSRKELDQKSRILLSRRQAKEDFDLFLPIAKKEGFPIGVLFFDIDGFKKLNTRYRETVIDKTILKDVQYLVKKISETRGSAARYGGDEFVIVLFNHDKAEIGVFAERLRKEFEKMSFRIDGKKEKVTISIGCSIYPEHGDNYKKVLEAANYAEHRAKDKKGNRVEIA